MISISSEGLYIADDLDETIPYPVRDKIKAIMTAVVSRGEKLNRGFIHRSISVGERSR
jgi:hypothetical protein